MKVVSQEEIYRRRDVIHNAILKGILDLCGWNLQLAIRVCREFEQRENAGFVKSQRDLIDQLVVAHMTIVGEISQEEAENATEDEKE